MVPGLGLNQFEYGQTVDDMLGPVYYKREVHLTDEDSVHIESAGKLPFIFLDQWTRLI